MGRNTSGDLLTPPSKNIKEKAEMEILTKTKSGNPVRLVIERDRYSVYQVYAYLIPPGGTAEESHLCNGWGTRKTESGMIEGVLVRGQVIEVPKHDWMAIAAEREDLRDRENLADIHLVKIFSHGDQLTIDAYTLSARVDRDTWSRIEPYMYFVDSSVNDILYAGDRFIGWVVEAGKEGEVENLLGVKPENSVRMK
jgi:hypothetical protein